MRRTVLPFAVLLLVGCSSSSHEDVTEGAFSSNEASLLEFDFDAELVTDNVWGNPIDAQLLYTMGHLNADRSVGRLDNVKITNVQKTPLDGGVTKFKFHVHLPVAWGRGGEAPTT